MTFFDIFQKRENLQQGKIIEKPRITADHGEKNSLVISELASLGIDVELKHLDVADFIVKDVAIERKTVQDFITSMINQRLKRQLEEIKQYPNNLLIIEGIEERELYPEENGINPNAIRGFLLSILINYKVPILFTKDYSDTAKFIAVLARKQESEMGIRAKKKSRNKKEQLQYILEGFPGIGSKSAKKLLKKYKTIKSIVSQDLEELRKDLGVKAEKFLKLVEEEY